MNKFVLIPDIKYRQLIANSSQPNNNSAVLQGIHQPVQREMLKRYNLAQNVLRNAPRTDASMAEYREAMDDFALLRDQGVRMTTSPKPESTNNTKDVLNDAVNLLPASQKANAQKLMNMLRSHDNVISWTPNGEVSIRGQRVPGTNVVDLVSDVLRPSTSKTIAPQREQFLSALADVNIPETVIKNKGALERYREIKTSGNVVERDDVGEERVSSTTPSKGSSSVGFQPKAKKSKHSPARNLQAALNWNAPH